MKRSMQITLLACVFMLCAGTMYGGTLYIPWFQDSCNTAVTGPTLVPADGEATFLRMQNVTGGSLDVSINYYGISGWIHENTGTMSAAEVWAWRPHQGQGLPPEGGGPVSGTVMSAIVSWSAGTNTDIVGNLVTINTNGSRFGVNMINP